MKFPVRFLLVFVISVFFFVMQAALAPQPMAQNAATETERPPTSPPKPTNTSAPKPTNTSAPSVVTVTSPPKPANTSGVTVVAGPTWTSSPSATSTGQAATSTSQGGGSSGSTPENDATRTALSNATATALASGALASPSSDPGEGAPAGVADPANGQNAATAQPTSPPSPGSGVGDVFTIEGEGFNPLLIGLVLLIALVFGLVRARRNT